jgi:hypothetical protein
LFAAYSERPRPDGIRPQHREGAKKNGQGSVFKDAADRVNETRNEKERFQKPWTIQSVEKELRS